MYRPTDSTSVSVMDSCYERLKEDVLSFREKEKVVLPGDFNANFIIDVLMNHCGAEKPAHTVQGEEFKKIMENLSLLSFKKPEEDMKAQLRELARNDMLVTMFSNLSALSNVCLSIPVATASVQQKFFTDETHQN